MTPTTQRKLYKHIGRYFTIRTKYVNGISHNYFCLCSNLSVNSTANPMYVSGESFFNF